MFDNSALTGPIDPLVIDALPIAYGEAKRGRLDRDYALSNTKLPSFEVMEELAAVARTSGVDVKVGG